MQFVLHLLVRQLAKQLPDKSIAPILNKLKLKTGADNNWTRDRIKTLRNYHQIPSYDKDNESDIITLDQVAQELGVCAQSIRNLIKQEIIKAGQVVPYAPWAIPVEELEKDEVKFAVERIRLGANRRNQYSRCESQKQLFQ